MEIARRWKRTKRMSHPTVTPLKALDSKVVEMYARKVGERYSTPPRPHRRVEDRASGRDLRRPSQIEKEHQSNVFHMVRRIRHMYSRRDAHKNAHDPVAHPVRLSPPHTPRILPARPYSAPSPAHVIDLALSSAQNDLHGWKNPHPLVLAEPPIDDLEIQYADDGVGGREEGRRNGRGNGNGNGNGKKKEGKKEGKKKKEGGREPRTSAAKLRVETFVVDRVMDEGEERLPELVEAYAGMLVGIKELAKLRSEVYEAGLSAIDRILRAVSPESASLHTRAFKLGFVKAYRSVHHTPDYRTYA